MSNPIAPYASEDQCNDWRHRAEINIQHAVALEEKNEIMENRMSYILGWKMPSMESHGIWSPTPGLASYILQNRQTIKNFNFWADTYLAMIKRHCAP